MQIFNQKYPNKTTWLGVTNASEPEAPIGHCIWTDVGSDLPFGQYWFQVRRVAFHNKEIFLKLKCLREYKKESKIEGIMKPEPWDITQYDPAAVAKSFTELLETWKKSLHDLILHACSIHVTFDNFKTFFRFICLLFISLCVGAVHGIHFLFNFIILFLHQISNLIRVSTPFLLGILDFFSKIIGGFYILIAMMWRDVVIRKPAQNVSRRLQYNPNNPQLWPQRNW